MDLTNYYELKYQPHNLRVFSETIPNQMNDGEDRMQLQSSSRSRSSVCSSSHQCAAVSGEGTAVHPTLHHPAVAGEGRITVQHLEELRKERQDLHNNTYFLSKQFLIFYSATCNRLHMQFTQYSFLRLWHLMLFILFCVLFCLN